MQGRNILGSSFTNTENVKTAIQLQRERQMWLFIKNRPIRFDINGIKIIKIITNVTSWVNLSYWPLHTSVHSVSLVQFKFKSQL